MFDYNIEELVVSVISEKERENDEDDGVEWMKEVVALLCHMETMAVTVLSQLKPIKKLNFCKCSYQYLCFLTTETS